MKLPNLPLIPNASAVLGDGGGRATVEWYNYWRKLGDAMRRSLEAEARHYQLKAAAIDPRTYVFGKTDTDSVTVPAGKVYLVTNMWRVKYAGMSQEVFQRKADARDYFLIPAGTTFQVTGSHATVQYCNPSIVTDPASPTYDQRYTDDPKGLYFERLEKLESIPLRQTGGTIAVGEAVGQSDVPIDWGDRTEQWGMIVHISTENLSWMLALAADGDTGVNLVPEISDVHANRLNSFPVLMPFTRETFTQIRLRGGTWDGNPLAVSPTQTYAAWGVIAWQPLDESSW